MTNNRISAEMKAAHYGLPKNAITAGAHQFGIAKSVHTRASSSFLAECFIVAKIRGEGGPDWPGGTSLSGLVVPYEQVSTLTGEQAMLFKRRAFQRTLRKFPDIAVTHCGNSAHIIGCSKSGTARIWEDPEGLHFEADPPVQASWAADLLVSINRGDVSGSAALCVPLGSKMEKRGDVQVLVIDEARVLQIAVGPFTPFTAGLTIKKPEDSGGGRP